MKKVIWFLAGAGLAMVLAGALILSPLWPTRAQEGVVTPMLTATARPMVTQEPTATPDSYSLVWERQGGVDPRCHRLTLFEGDRAHFGYCDEGLTFADLDDLDWATYMGYVTQYGTFNTTIEGGAGAITAVRFRGRGAQTASISAQQEIAEWAESLYERLYSQERRAELVALSRQHLADDLGISSDAIATKSVEEVTWPDACLGLPSESLYCAQVATRGLSVILLAGGKEYECRTDMYDLVLLADSQPLHTVTPTGVPSATIAPISPPTAMPTATPRPTSTPWPTMPSVPITEWRGEYYGNARLEGYPLIVRNDSAIRFDWGSGSPSPGLPADQFSVRWSRRIRFSEGDYHFILNSDDGTRVWVAGNLIIDAWWPGSHEVMVKQHIMDGEHLIIVEYYDQVGQADTSLYWEKFYAPKSPTPTRTPVLEPAITEWRGEYHVGTRIGNEPVLVRNDMAISFDWGGSSPAPELPDDAFAVRWTRRLPLDRGAYRFHASMAGAVHVKIDGQTVISERDEQIDEAVLGYLWLDAGFHDFQVDYLHYAAEAKAHFWIESLESFQGWRGEYYANRNLEGNPYLVRDDPLISFDWGSGRPWLGLPTDRFSVRWSRQEQFAAGRYEFRAYADDGVRLYVNGDMLIDEWHSSPGRTYKEEIDLVGGAHEVVVEYYEDGAHARVAIAWEMTAGPTATSTSEPTATLTRTSTQSPTSTLTATATDTSSPTHTATSSVTPSSTATITATPTVTPTATPTGTAANTPTRTPMPDADMTATPDPYATPTATLTWVVGRPIPTTSLTPAIRRTPLIPRVYYRQHLPEWFRR